MTDLDKYTRGWMDAQILQAPATKHPEYMRGWRELRDTRSKQKAGDRTLPPINQG